MTGGNDVEEFVTVARVLKTQGRTGEVLAELLTDFPERFAERQRFYLLPERGERRVVQLESHWFHKGGVVLKFAGISSISEAEHLLRSQVQVPREERTQLEEGATYVSDLLGCEVFDISGQTPKTLGTVHDVNFSAGEAPLLEVKGEKEFLIPYVESFLRKVDLRGKRIEMVLPQGMLELDAALTQEERNRQRAEADEARAAGQRGKRRP